MTTRLTFNLLLLILLSGCATSYGPATFLSGGYEETEINPGIFRVSFKGNDSTDMQRAADFALLRSAELAIERGYSYITILEADQWVATASYTTPTHTTTTVTGTSAGGVATAAGTSTTVGGQTLTSNAPRVALVVRLHSDADDLDERTLGAAFVVESLKTKYKIEDGEATE